MRGNSDTFTSELIKMLLSVYALVNMFKAEGSIGYMETALGWMPTLERLLKSLKEDMERELRRAKGEEG